MHNQQKYLPTAGHHHHLMVKGLHVNGRAPPTLFALPDSTADDEHMVDGLEPSQVAPLQASVCCGEGWNES